MNGRFVLRGDPINRREQIVGQALFAKLSVDAEPLDHTDICVKTSPHSNRPGQWCATYASSERVCEVKQSEKEYIGVLQIGSKPATLRVQIPGIVAIVVSQEGSERSFVSYIESAVG
jgi:hypothetical protein